jgi:hypothetical protein
MFPGYRSSKFALLHGIESRFSPQAHNLFSLINV